MLSCRPGLDIPDIEKELNNQADVDNLMAAVERLLGRNPNLAAGQPADLYVCTRDDSIKSWFISPHSQVDAEIIRVRTSTLPRPLLDCQVYVGLMTMQLERRPIMEHPSSL